MSGDTLSPADALRDLVAARLLFIRAQGDEAREVTGDALARAIGAARDALRF